MYVKRKITIKDVLVMYIIFKSIIDRVMAIVLLIILSPVFFLLAILIKTEDGKSVFYFQERITKKNKKFNIIKFRTMKINAENEILDLLKDKTKKKEWNENFKLKDDPRVTKIGKILRKTSLDELPQIINVIEGNMSFIGPRPIVEEEFNKFNYCKEEILKVLPGITGWWACNATNSTSYSERIDMEEYYVKNISLKLDLECMFKTIYSLISMKKYRKGR